MYWRAAQFAVTPLPGIPNWELLSTTSGFFVWFLAAVQRCGIDTIFEYRIFSSFITALNPVLIYLVGRIGLKSKYIGYIAAIAFAVSPSALHFDTIVSKTNLEIGLFLLVVVCTFKVMNLGPARKSLYYAAALGFSLAILGLLQKASFFAAVLVAFTLAINRGMTLKERLKHTIVAAGVFTFFLIAFQSAILQNYKTTPVDGYNLYISLNPDSDGLYKPLDNVPSNLLGHAFFSRLAAERQIGHRITFEEANSFYWNRALQNIKDSPKKFLNVELKKIRLLFNDTENRGEEYFLHLKSELKMLSLNPLTFGAFLMFAPLGMFFLFREKNYQAILTLGIPFLTSSAICLILFPMWRYRYALTPVLALLAAAGIYFLFRAMKKRSYIALVICFAACGAWNYIVFQPLHSAEYLERSMKIASENRQLTLTRASTTKVMEEIGAAHPGSTMQRDLTIAKCQTSLYSFCNADLTQIVKTDRTLQLGLHYYVDSLLMLNKYEEAAQFFQELGKEDPNLVNAMISRYRESPLILHAITTYIIPQ